MAEASTFQRIPRRLAGSRGFTYLSLIILVAIIALVAATSLKLGSVLQRNRAETELLEIGAAFSDALKSYADATPQGQPPQPPSLKELLKDPRFPGTRRHLRKLFVDPVTGKPEWGIVYLGDKVGVLAVYSLSNDKPVKVGNFPARYSGFDGKSHISEWKFTMASDLPGAATMTGTQPQIAPAVPALQQNMPAPLPAPSLTPAPAAPIPAAPAPAPETPPAPSEEPTPAPPPPPPQEPENPDVKQD
jgi:type II secretory pathway pseudopilin PulG